MALVTIYPTRNGFLYNINGAGSWDGARDSTSGIVYGNTSITSATRGIQVYKDLGRGAGTYLVTRTFMCFALSSIPAGSTINSATFSIMKGTSQSSDGGTNIIIKSNAFGGDGLSLLASADMINYPGYSAGATMSGAVTDYSSTFDFSTSTIPFNTYCNVTLNTTAKNDIASGAGGSGVITMMIVDYTYDYQDTIPAVDPTYLSNTFYFDGYTGTSRDPKLVVDYTAAGYGKDVIGVTSTNIVNINDVATADIVNVIGVS